MDKLRLNTLLLLSLLLGFSVCLLIAMPSDQASNLELVLEAFNDTDSDTVLISAHRGLMGRAAGCWERYPENSLSAIADSIENGADIVEVDVRSTRDGHLIPMHDKTFDRLTDGVGRVSEMTLEQVGKLRLRVKNLDGTPGALTEEHVPTLRQVLSLCKGRCMVALDKVSSGVLPKVQELLNELDMAEQAIYIVYYNSAVTSEYFKPIAPPAHYMPLVRTGDTADKDECLQKFQSYLEVSDPSAFHIIFRKENDPVVKYDVIGELRRKGVRVWCNSLWGSHCGGYDDKLSVADPDAGWGWMIDRGINIIQTDEGHHLLQYLRSKGLHW